MNLFSLQLHSNASIQYEDNRKNLSETTADTHQRISSLAVALVLDDYFSSNHKKDKEISLPFEPLNRWHEKFPVCPGSKFYEEPTAGHCTSFLVKSNILISAGHCFGSPHHSREKIDRLCQNHYKFAFGFNDLKKKLTIFKPETDIYSCKKIHFYKNPKEKVLDTDIAIIELKRHVNGFTPLQIQTDSPQINTPVFLSGHPLGLPLKVSEGKIVNGLIHSHFKTVNKSSILMSDVNTFSVNSGSPLIDSKTGHVLGVASAVVNSSFLFKNGSGCFEIKPCNENKCFPVYFSKISSEIKTLIDNI